MGLQILCNSERGVEKGRGVGGGRWWASLHITQRGVRTEIASHTVEPRLSEPHGRHTIRPDNRGVRIDEGNRNSPSMGYRVGDN